MIDIILNGRDCQITTDNLGEALAELGHKRGFAIAVNKSFIPQCDYAKTTLQAGDQVELVVPMQGG